jgi:hypothetical protein
MHALLHEVFSFNLIILRSIEQAKHSSTGLLSPSRAPGLLSPSRAIKLCWSYTALLGLVSPYKPSWAYRLVKLCLAHAFVPSQGLCYLSLSGLTALISSSSIFHEKYLVLHLRLLCSSSIFFGKRPFVREMRTEAHLAAFSDTWTLLGFMLSLLSTASFSCSALAAQAASREISRANISRDIFHENYLELYLKQLFSCYSL